MGFFKRDKIAQTGQAPQSDMEVIGKKSVQNCYTLCSILLWLFVFCSQLLFFISFYRRNCYDSCRRMHLP